MKKTLTFLVTLITYNLSIAQTILSGSELFGKDRKEGVYMNLNIEKKYIDKDWPLFIAKFGNVAQNKEVFNIASASIPDITSEPINLMTKVTSEQKNKTQVFASFDIAGTTISSSSENYAGVEKVMKDFYDYAMQNEDVRLAERDSDEAQKSYNRVQKTGEKIARDIERNKREKESLLKKIEENKEELEKLLQDQITNKQDQENGKITIEEKQKAVSTVKTRKQ